MNRTYALVWNHCLGVWTVANEHARRRGKGAGAVLATALLLPLAGNAADLPTGGQVVAGQGQIGTPSNNQMIIDQASNKLAINWQSFDIAAGNKVTFNQPGTDSIALNRVLGADGSKIMGQLDANGRVFIINPNGVLFGQNAQVNVGGLVASTLDISNSDFEAGNYSFKGDGSNASVINNGTITATDGGAVALLGGTVSNNGVIIANQGSVALAAGNKVTLDFAGDGLLNVQVDEAVVDALVENHHLIRAEGGQVLLTADAGEALLKTVVNNTGVIEAQTLGNKKGKIVLLGGADGGTVQVAGSLDASATNGSYGGFIETSGAHVKVAGGTQITSKAANGGTGTWRVNSSDFTVSAGSVAQTDSGIGADTLASNLANNNVVLATANTSSVQWPILVARVAAGNPSGDIHVNGSVTWNADTTLTLNARNNINVNAAITAQHGNGKVALQYGQNSADGGTADYFINAPINLQSGWNFITQKGSTGDVIAYTVVNDAQALQNMNLNLSGNYAVGSNIDLSSIANWQPVGRDGGWQPLDAFTGRFDGLGHTLSNLTIDRSNTDNVGLFGYIGRDSVIRDIDLVGGSVKGGSNVGGLVGYNSYGTISSSSFEGTVTGYNHVGGLVGINEGGQWQETDSGQSDGRSDGHITDSHARGKVVASGDHAGGLVGSNSGGNISGSYAEVDVEGVRYVGGLLGRNWGGQWEETGPDYSYSEDSGNITDSHASGKVVASGDYAGGLVGRNEGGNIRDAYAEGQVEGVGYVGGLVGSNRGAHWQYTEQNYSETANSGQITGSHANGKVIASGDYAGGLVGANDNGNISESYATGDVSGAASVGGLVGDNTGSVSQTVDGSGTRIADNGHIRNSHASGNVTSTVLDNSLGMRPIAVGGLVGSNSGNISGSHASGNVLLAFADSSFMSFAGGLVGVNQGEVESDEATGEYTRSGHIHSSYASGKVDGSIAGGLVGLNGGLISASHAQGNVTSSGIAGGLVGMNTGLFGNPASPHIENSYATGNVHGHELAGGLVGYNAGEISQTYASGQATGESNGLLVGVNEESGAWIIEWVIKQSLAMAHEQGFEVTDEMIADLRDDLVGTYGQISGRIEDSAWRPVDVEPEPASLGALNASSYLAALNSLTKPLPVQTLMSTADFSAALPLEIEEDGIRLPEGI